jgi:hypothetical protein
MPHPLFYSMFRIIEIMLHTLIDLFFEQSSPEMCSLRESLKVECDTREANVNLTVYTV